VTVLLALWLAFGDLAAVKAEPDLDKRSELALVNADHDIDEARKASTDGNPQTLQAALTEVAASVDLSYESLQETHKEPRKSKYYKRAEIQLQALMRRLNGLRDDVGYLSRPAVDSVLKKVSDVHDRIISDIMSRKK
jgi:hypothetical protein